MTDSISLGRGHYAVINEKGNLDVYNTSHSVKTINSWLVKYPPESSDANPKIVPKDPDSVADCYITSTDKRKSLRFPSKVVSVSCKDPLIGVVTEDGNAYLSSFDKDELKRGMLEAIGSGHFPIFKQLKLKDQMAAFCEMKAIKIRCSYFGYVLLFENKKMYFKLVTDDDSRILPVIQSSTDLEDMPTGIIDIDTDNSSLEVAVAITENNTFHRWFQTYLENGSLGLEEISQSLSKIDGKKIIYSQWEALILTESGQVWLHNAYNNESSQIEFPNPIQYIFSVASSICDRTYLAIDTTGKMYIWKDHRNILTLDLGLVTIMAALLPTKKLGLFLTDDRKILRVDLSKVRFPFPYY